MESTDRTILRIDPYAVVPAHGPDASDPSGIFPRQLAELVSRSCSVILLHCDSPDTFDNDTQAEVQYEISSSFPRLAEA